MKTYNEIINLLIEKDKDVENIAKELKTNKKDIEKLLDTNKFPNSRLIKKICKYLDIFESEFLYAMHKEKEKEEYSMAARAHQIYIQDMHLYEKKKKRIK